MKIDMNLIIENLKSKRKIFHSEADLQFALAWEINELYPEIDVRLEYAYKIDNKIYHVDIMLIRNNQFIPIELKYKTSNISLTLAQEDFELRNHSAQDGGKYDFIKDIVRLETLLSRDSKFIAGYSVMLTNDSSYWKGSMRENTCCADFDIGDGKMIKGLLKWADHASAGTKKGREEPLYLSGQYDMKWQNYCKLDTRRNGTFNYISVEVVR